MLVLSMRVFVFDGGVEGGLNVVDQQMGTHG